MRFYGAVGYASSEQATPGVFSEVITEISYFGDVLRAARRLESPSQVPPLVNEDISLENSISIMADDQAYANFTNMRYVVWNEQYWTITNVEIRNMQAAYPDDWGSVGMAPRPEFQTLLENITDGVSVVFQPPSKCADELPRDRSITEILFTPRFCG